MVGLVFARLLILSSLQPSCFAWSRPMTWPTTSDQGLTILVPSAHLR
jgi:hypothetical protein